MRANLTILLAMLLALALAGVGDARAERKAADKEDDWKSAQGDYDVKFEEIANNCTRTGMNLRKGTISLGEHRADMTLTVPMASTMYGSPPRKGKFRVKSKLGGTGIQGVLGKFSASGRVDNGVVQFVFVAEFYTANEKPLCTQSWNASGVKQ